MMTVTEEGIKPVRKQENGLYTVGDTIDCRPALLAAYKRLWDRHPLTVCEVGVQRGDNAEIIRQILEPDRMILIDRWERRIASAGSERYLKPDEDYLFTWDRFRDTKIAEIWKLDSRRALPFMPDNLLDFLYIDGDHTEQACRQDILNGLRVVKVGCILGGHDYGYQTQINARYLPAMGDVDAAVSRIFEGRTVYGETGDWWVVVTEDLKDLGRRLRTKRNGRL